jgi:hypothetical protein
MLAKIKNGFGKILERKILDGGEGQIERRMRPNGALSCENDGN